MSAHAGPLYELNFVIADDALESVDAWLKDVLTRVQRHDSVVTARTFQPEAQGAGRSARSCQILVRDDSSLDALVDGLFAEIDAEAAARFSSNVSIESRVYRADPARELPHGESPVCLNCGTRLRGQYCGSCGQRSRSRLISIWGLLREAFGDLFELDSRLWRTLGPLLSKPGQLTRDYLEGRRARYMPPFRTYLVLSVLFFVVAFFDPREDLKVFFEPEPPPMAEEIAQIDAASIAVNLQHDAAEKEDPGSSEDSAEDENDSDFFGDCENATITDDDDLPEWLKKRLTNERIQQICENNKARGSDSFVDAIVDKVPVALIVLLPFMAMVLKVLYPLSRRYFVEHLLFFVHFHAFFFLILLLQVLFVRLMGLFQDTGSEMGTIATIVIVATSFYIPVYLYKAMRRVYGQGHLTTILKYLVLTATYLTGATITMMATLVVAVITA